tara:strand:- start:156 stop:473 length:318 start_codon:yes stop_codon:yes gene_type:complete
MNTFIITNTQNYNENTAEYGFGDYPAQITYIVTVVNADTRRKAQNVAKKEFPNLSFGGQFGNGIYKTDDEFAYLYTKPADQRLSQGALNLHNAGLKKLFELVKLT